MAVALCMRTVSRVSVVVLIVLAAGTSLAGCVLDDGDVDPTKLAALKTERLATMKLPGGRLVLQSEIDADDRPALFSSKPSDASITRVFAYSDAKRAQQGLVAALAAARASGWRLSLEGARESPIFGRKRLSTGGITLIIGWYEDKDDNVHKVSIRLEHRPCAVC